MNSSELQAKRDAEFYKAYAKDKTLTRANYYAEHPITHTPAQKGFKDAPRSFKADAPSVYHKEIYKKLAIYCEKFPNVETPNVILWGPTGTGKTYTAQIIANALFDKGINVVYTTAFAMVASFQKYVQSFGTDTVAIEPMLECDLLIIDDLGSEPTIKNVTQEYIYNIINERLTHNRPFIITTNLSPTDLLDRYDQRIASRISHTKNSARIEFKGGDLRR